MNPTVIQNLLDFFQLICFDTMPQSGGGLKGKSEKHENDFITHKPNSPDSSKFRLSLGGYSS